MACFTLATPDNLRRAALAVALSAFFQPMAGNSAQLLFSTNFGPTQSVLRPPTVDGTEGDQAITGVNAATGVSGPITPWGATRSYFQMIADVPVTLATLGDHISNEIQLIPGPTGAPAYALFQNLKINNAGPPTYGASQDPFMIQRDSVASGDMTDTGDVYFTYWFKFQPDLHTQLGTNGGDSWRVMSEWKTGGLTLNGPNSTWQGDYRTITHVEQDEFGHLFWNTQGDTEANGISNFHIYWQVTNNVVPVPVGEWFKYEVFWHRGPNPDGRYWAAVNGQVIVDHTGASWDGGSTSLGIYNLPINRIMLSNAYSGGRVPIQQWITGLEIWDGFPCGVGVSCFGASGVALAPPTHLRVME